MGVSIVYNITRAIDCLCWCCVCHWISFLSITYIIMSSPRHHCYPSPFWNSFDVTNSSICSPNTVPWCILVRPICGCRYCSVPQQCIAPWKHWNRNHSHLRMYYLCIILYHIYRFTVMIFTDPLCSFYLLLSSSIPLPICWDQHS